MPTPEGRTTLPIISSMQATDFITTYLYGSAIRRRPLDWHASVTPVTLQQSSAGYPSRWCYQSAVDYASEEGGYPVSKIKQRSWWGTSQWCVEQYFEHSLCGTLMTIRSLIGVTILPVTILPLRATRMKQNQIKYIPLDFCKYWLFRSVSLWLTICFLTPVSRSCLCLYMHWYQ